MKYGTRLAIGLLICSTASMGSAWADTFLGLYAGAGNWEQNYSGTMESRTSSVDVEEDLAIEDERNAVFYIALEHGAPFLPNLRAQHFSLDVDGRNVLSRTIEFNGRLFSMAEAVDSLVDVEQSDAVLYYEVLDNIVSLDVGMSVSFLEGTIQVASLTETANAEFDEVVPMMYAKARTDLPLTGMWLGAEVQGISYADTRLTQFNAQVGWTGDLGLGFEAGYRAVRMELEAFDEVDAVDLDVRGPYAAINYHF